MGLDHCHHFYSPMCACAACTNGEQGQTKNRSPVRKGFTLITLIHYGQSRVIKQSELPGSGLLSCANPGQRVFEVYCLGQNGRTMEQGPGLPLDFIPHQAQ